MLEAQSDEQLPCRGDTNYKQVSEVSFREKLGKQQTKECGRRGPPCENLIESRRRNLKGRCWDRKPLGRSSALQGRASGGCSNWSLQLCVENPAGVTGLTWLIAVRQRNLSTGPRAEDRLSSSINCDGLLAARSAPQSLQGRRRQRSRLGGVRAWHNDGLGKGWGFSALLRRLLASSWAGGDLHKAGFCRQATCTEWGWSRPGGKLGLQVLRGSWAGLGRRPRLRPQSRCPEPPSTNPHPARPFLPSQSPFPYSGYSFDPGPGDPAPPAGEGSRGREEGDGLKAGSFGLVLHGWLPQSPPATPRVPAFPSPV